MTPKTTPTMKKKVLVFRTDYLPLSETFISDHLRSLKRYQPLIACRFDLAAAHRIAAEPTLVANDWLEDKAFALLGHSKTFGNYLKTSKPDLVHAHFLTDAVKILPQMERNTIPFVVTAHGFDATMYDKYHLRTNGGRLLLLRRKRLMARVDKILCVSDFIKDEMLKRGYPADKLQVAHLGVDLSTLARRQITAADAKGILYVGRLVEKKGTRYLIEAYAKLPAATQKQHPLTIIGDGPERDALEALAQKLNVNPVFMGAQSRNTVVAKLRAASIFVLPSIRATNGDAEGMPIAIMESLAIGVPVCIFNDQPLAHTLQARTAGVLATPKDTTDLSAQIEKVLVNPTRADLISNNGRVLVEETFDLFKNTAQLEGIYDAVTRKAKPHHHGSN
jgi:glycosyltransferase involved in cell wall biosynthesis